MVNKIWGTILHLWLLNLTFSAWCPLVAPSPCRWGEACFSRKDVFRGTFESSRRFCGASVSSVAVTRGVMLPERSILISHQEPVEPFFTHYSRILMLLLYWTSICEVVSLILLILSLSSVATSNLTVWADMDGISSVIHNRNVPLVHYVMKNGFNVEGSVAPGRTVMIHHKFQLLQQACF